MLGRAEAKGCSMKRGALLPWVVIATGCGGAAVEPSASPVPMELAPAEAVHGDPVEAAGGAAPLETALPVPAQPSPPEPAPTPAEGWQTYQFDQRFECVGPQEELLTPYGFELPDHRAVIHGHRMVVTSRAEPAPTVKLGVLSAIKDDVDGTKDNIRRFVAWFRSEGVAAILVNGDTGYDGDDIAASLEVVAEGGLLVLAMVGNADPVSGFNRALRDLSAEHPHVVNMNLVRSVRIDGVTLVGLPGYHDERFITGGSGCQYYRDEVNGLGRLLEAASGDRVLVMHGPPLGKGKGALDYAFDAGNVGDPRLAAMVAKRGLKFGIFGHILEAGGRAVQAGTSRRVKAGAWSESLWINAGSASSVEQDLHGGSSHRGMAAIFEIGEGKARHRFRRASGRK